MSRNMEFLLKFSTEKENYQMLKSKFIVILFVQSLSMTKFTRSKGQYICVILKVYNSLIVAA